MERPKIKFYRERISHSEGARRFGFKSYQSIEQQERSDRPSKFKRTKEFLMPSKVYGKKTGKRVIKRDIKKGRRSISKARKISSRFGRFNKPQGGVNHASDLLFG